MNITPSQYINLFAGRLKWLDFLGIFCARWLGYTMAAFLLVFAYWQNNPAMFFVPVFSAVVSRFTINELIWLFYRKKRPSSSATTKVLVKIPKSPSFPSSHTTFFFVISFLLLFYNIPLAIVYIICSCFIAFARVFCGVHWFADIFGGLLIALLSASFFWQIFLYFK